MATRLDTVRRQGDRTDIVDAAGPVVTRLEPAPTGPPAEAPSTRGHVVVVVPDATLAAALACRFEGRGFTAKVAADAEGARRLLRAGSADAVVVDLDTLGFSPREIIGDRPSRDNPVTVVLRRSAEPAERVRWLEAGASDFVPSPVWPDEVVARVVAVLRRGSAADRHWPIVVGTICINDETGEVEVDGQRRVLSPMELKLFRHLASSPGTVFSRHDLLRDVWGYTTGADATVTVHIRKLREKIERNSKRPRLLRTRHGTGYYLSLDATR